MSTLESLISSVYKLSEFDIAQASAELEEPSSGISIIELNNDSTRSFTMAAVDSGFLPIKYLGILMGLVNTVTVMVPGRFTSSLKVVTIGSEDELETVAKAEEFNNAARVITDFEVLIMDGPLVINNAELLSKLGALLNSALTLNHYVLSFTKEVRHNRVLRGLSRELNEPSVFLLLFEKYRLKTGSRSILISQPVVVGKGIIGFYLQSASGTPPAYVEASDNLLSNMSVLGFVGAVLSRENYPIPLYVADKLSKISGDLRRWFSMALLRVSQNIESDIVLNRYIRDALGLARGKGLYG